MTHVKGNTTAGTWEAVGEAESEPEICLPEICIHWLHSDPKHLQLMTALQMCEDNTIIPLSIFSTLIRVPIPYDHFCFSDSLSSSKQGAALFLDDSSRGQWIGTEKSLDPSWPTGSCPGLFKWKLRQVKSSLLVGAEGCEVWDMSAAMLTVVWQKDPVQERK